MNRVAITGLGVVAPNAIGVAEFKKALRSKKSGIRHFEELEQLNFGCQIGGMPIVSEELLAERFTPLELKRIKSEGVIYGILAGIEAWEDAGFSIAKDEILETDWDSGCIFGAGLSGMNMLRSAIYTTDEGKVKKLGTTVVEQTMPNGISAYLGGRLGFGNQVSTNASACSTGTESIYLAAEKIRNGSATRMLAGSCDAGGPHVWGGFDSMRVLTRKSNDNPTQGSRSLDANAAGFVPGCGAGAMVLENYDEAVKRGVKIYGEILGGHVNSGGQRTGGTMTAPNPEGIQRCIAAAFQNAAIQPDQVDLICGHLTSTMGDPLEIQNWSKALGRSGAEFPMINTIKSMIGHCLSAAGSIECVSAVLQLADGFVHGSLNIDTLHPKVAEIIDAKTVVLETIDEQVNIVAKSSFGFGDVNSCLIFAGVDKA